MIRKNIQHINLQPADTPAHEAPDFLAYASGFSPFVRSGTVFPYDAILENGTAAILDPAEIARTVHNRSVTAVADFLNGLPATEKPMRLIVSAVTLGTLGFSPELQLAYTFAAAIRVFACLKNGDVNRSNAIKPELLWGIGPVYFEEIAKLRATRLLWSVWLGKRGITSYPNPLPVSCRQIADDTTESDLSKDITRRLIATAIAKAAAIPLEDDLDETTRHFVKHEAGLERTIDPWGGNEKLERRTLEITAGALEILSGIEAVGGFDSWLRSGILATELEKLEPKLSDE